MTNKQAINNNNNNNNNNSSSSSSNGSYVEPEMRRAIEGQLISTASNGVTFNDVVGLAEAKSTLVEMVIWPALRPDLFTGLRQPATGLLLYGPPGTGKTYLAKAVASEAKCSFFSISASVLVSRTLGDGEKMVKALFTIARERAPSVIFIDEIDSIMGKRNSSTEHEASRRLKTEMLVQMDGISDAKSTTNTGRVYVLAATNRPEDLDSALLRRLPRTVYIPLPDPTARRSLLEKLMQNEKTALSPADLDHIVRRTEQYSMSDLTQLAREASLEPLRQLQSSSSSQNMAALSHTAIPPINLFHFQKALKRIKATPIDLA